MKGNLERTLYIPNTEVAGEIESLGFYYDTYLLICYNRKICDNDIVSFYKTDFKER